MNKCKRLKVSTFSLLALLMISVCGCGNADLNSSSTDNTSSLIVSEQAPVESVQDESSQDESLGSKSSDNANIQDQSEYQTDTEKSTSESVEESVQVAISEQTFDASAIPSYTGSPYTIVNDNIPFFADSDMVDYSYEYYSELDDKERCGVCIACVGIDLMPTEERGEIGNVKPSGWNQEKYPGVVDGNYLYNRCHLIGFQLTGENDNIRNLITGTRYLNVEGMLPFENMVADYVKETKNHVLYRVTPIFTGVDLLTNGVLMEAKSVEDDGEGILFCVYCYNVQPQITIDYSDGSSYLNKPVQVEVGNEENTPVIEDSQEVISSDTSIATEAPQTSESSDEMVWLSATGSNYHSINNCGKMNPDKATQVSESEAINMGLGKCSKCW